MKEQCVDKNVGPAARCRSEEIRGVCICVKVLKQRMAFCNFPLAAAERCERVNVDVYAPRNMLNVIDSMAEINTYWKAAHAHQYGSIFRPYLLHVANDSQTGTVIMPTPLLTLC